MRIRFAAPGRSRLAGAGIVGLAALLVGATLAGAASAATLGVNAACYRNVLSAKAPAMIVTGTGYTPGDSVSVTSSDGSVDASTTANPAGVIALKTNPPRPSFTAPVAKTLTLTASDNAATGATTTASTPVMVAPLGFSHGSTKKAPGLRALTEDTDWAFSGFAPGRTVYAHYTIKGRQVARQAFGRAAGPCGLLRARRRLYPATPHTNSYPLQVDSVRRYSKRTALRVLGRVSLQLEF